MHGEIGSRRSQDDGEVAVEAVRKEGRKKERRGRGVGQDQAGNGVKREVRCLEGGATAPKRKMVLDGNCSLNGY